MSALAVIGALLMVLGFVAWLTFDNEAFGFISCVGIVAIFTAAMFGLTHKVDHQRCEQFERRGHTVEWVHVNPFTHTCYVEGSPGRWVEFDQIRDVGFGVDQ